MADVALIDIHKRYGDAVAVGGVSLEVADGEMVTLLGPSGCGKTTLLRTIAGITVQDAGEVRVGGQVIDRLPPERRNVGLVFQSYALFPHKTVAGNVAFGLRMRRVNRTEMAERVRRALALVDLAAYEDRFPRELSGGQQQRVALARAIVIEPSVLLLDEPLSNLDAKLREHLREDLRALQQQVKATAIYVTHDQSEAMALSDRIVVMNQGAIVEIGDPMTLYRAPRHRFTAEFLGQTNVIEADVAAGTIRLPWGAEAPHTGPDGRLALSLRPEDLALAPGETGKVLETTFLGSGILYRVDLRGTELRVRMDGEGAQVLAPGTPVDVTLPGRLHVLEEAA